MRWNWPDLRERLADAGGKARDVDMGEGEFGDVEQNYRQGRQEI